MTATAKQIEPRYTLPLERAVKMRFRKDLRGREIPTRSLSDVELLEEHAREFPEAHTAQPQAEAPAPVLTLANKNDAPAEDTPAQPDVAQAMAQLVAALTPAASAALEAVEVVDNGENTVLIYENGITCIVPASIAADALTIRIN